MLLDEVGVDPVGPRDGVDGPVVGGRVDPPEASIGEIGEAWGESVAEQGEQGEDLVGVGGGVGGDHLGSLTSIELEESVEDVERVADRSGDDDATEAGVLIVEVDEPGEPS